MSNNYESYADVLESYMIAEEGILSGIKSVGKMAWKGLLRIIEIIKNGLNHIREKLRNLLSRKKKNNSKESKKEAINRLEEEKAKLQERLNALTAKTTDTYNKLNAENTKLRNDIKNRNEDVYWEKRKNYQNTANKNAAIARLKEEIAKKDEQIKSLKEQKDSMKYASFDSMCMKFISHVSMQINKANTALPRVISEAKKYDAQISNDDDAAESIYDKIEASVPTKSSGIWTNLYRSIKGSLPYVREDKRYIEFNSTLGRGFELLVTQGTATIDLLEKMVKEMKESDDNKPRTMYHWIISKITRDDGFIGMVQSSVSLANEILDCYSAHGVRYSRTVHDAI